MKKVFKLIQENPKEFIEVLRERFCSKQVYLANSHWEDFDGKEHLIFFERENEVDENDCDDDPNVDEIWFAFEDDLEGSTQMVMGMDIKKPDGILKFKGYAFTYRLDYDWND
jgi:hypothetical protein